VVVMNQTLEHLPNPVEELRRVADHLSPGGHLVGEVPNWDSPWRKLFPRHWGGLQIPRHQTFFTSATLESVLTNSGFKLKRLMPLTDPGDLGVSLCNWISDQMRLPTPPRQSWLYLPSMIASAPLVLLQVLVLPRTATLGFAAVKARRSNAMKPVSPG
jgi:hypothetical protein